MFNNQNFNSVETKADCVATFEAWGCESGTVKCHPLCENRNYTGFETKY